MIKSWQLSISLISAPGCNVTSSSAMSFFRERRLGHRRGVPLVGRASRAPAASAAREPRGPSARSLRPPPPLVGPGGEASARGRPRSPPRSGRRGPRGARPLRGALDTGSPCHGAGACSSPTERRRRDAGSVAQFSTRVRWLRC